MCFFGLYEHKFQFRADINLKDETESAQVWTYPMNGVTLS